MFSEFYSASPAFKGHFILGDKESAFVIKLCKEVELRLRCNNRQHFRPEEDT